MLKEKAVNKLEELCKNKLKRYMESNNIKAYGNLQRYEYGYKIWGESKTGNRLYYVDKEVIKVWKGKYDKWQTLQKGTYTLEEVVTASYHHTKRKLHPFKAYYDGKEIIYESAKLCAETLGIDITYVYQMARNGKKYKGMQFEKLPLYQGVSK